MMNTLFSYSVVYLSPPNKNPEIIHLSCPVSVGHLISGDIDDDLYEVVKVLHSTVDDNTAIYVSNEKFLRERSAAAKRARYPDTGPK